MGNRDAEQSGLVVNISDETLESKSGLLHRKFVCKVEGRSLVIVNVPVPSSDGTWSKKSDAYKKVKTHPALVP